MDYEALLGSSVAFVFQVSWLLTKVSIRFDALSIKSCSSTHDLSLSSLPSSSENSYLSNPTQPPSTNSTVDWFPFHDQSLWHSHLLPLFVESSTSHTPNIITPTSYFWKKAIGVCVDVLVRTLAWFNLSMLLISSATTTRLPIRLTSFKRHPYSTSLDRGMPHTLIQTNLCPKTIWGCHGENKANHLSNQLLFSIISSRLCSSFLDSSIILSPKCLSLNDEKPCKKKTSQMLIIESFSIIHPI